MNNLLYSLLVSLFVGAVVFVLVGFGSYPCGNGLRLDMEEAVDRLVAALQAAGMPSVASALPNCRPEDLIPDETVRTWKKQLSNAVLPGHDFSTLSRRCLVGRYSGRHTLAM